MDVFESSVVEIRLGYSTCMLNAGPHFVYCVFLLHQGNVILTACADSTLRILDARTGAMQYTLQGHTGSIEHMHFDGTTIISIGSDRYM